MTGYEFGRTIYLLLLVLFIGGFLLVPGRGRRMTQLKQMLTWVGIFLLLIIAYAQRDTIMSQLFPSTPQRIDMATVALNRSPGGSFEATLRVNGVPVRFLVDTGATDIVLTMEDARRIGLDPDRLRFDGSAMTANGRVSTAGVRLDTVEFAGITDRNVPASVNAGALGVSLLGMRYLDRFERIEIRGDQMLLIRQ